MNEVHALWIDGPLGPLERLSIASYVHHGYHVHLWTYGDCTHDTATVHDAREIVPEPILRYTGVKTKGSFILHVNYWRYVFLRDRGGCVTELDQICLGEIPEFPFVSSELSGNEPHANLAIMNLPAGTPLMQETVKEFERRLPDRRKDKRFGPGLLHEMVSRFPVEIAPWWRFCPIGWWEVNKIFYYPDIHEGALGCQVWGAVLRQKGIDVNDAQAGSLWRQWEQRFL